MRSVQGRDDEGLAMASGTYLYRLVTANLEASRTMTLVR